MSDPSDRTTAMRNVEIKASIRDSEAIKSKARELSGTDATRIQQTDTFFKVFNDSGRLKLRRFEDGSGELIFYRRDDVAGPKLSRYSKTALERDECRGVLDVLAESNGIIGTIEKTRYVYLVGQSRVHVDRVTGLGDFAEIEVVLTDDQPISDGEKMSKHLMEKLGIDPVDLIPNAYLDLAASAGSVALAARI